MTRLKLSMIINIMLPSKIIMAIIIGSKLSDAFLGATFVALLFWVP